MIYVKRVVSIATFLLGMFLILLITSFIFVPKNNMKGFGIENVPANGILGEKANTVDVLILGDSETYSAISPMEIWNQKGYTAYVCGTSAQTLEKSNEMLAKALKTQKPKIVILETNAIYRKLKFEKKLGKKLGDKFSVFRYHNRWKHIRMIDFYTIPEYTWSDDNKGFYYDTTVIPSTSLNYMAENKKNAVIPEQNMQDIKALKQTCDENGIRLILLSTPSTKNWNSRRHAAIDKLSNELNCEYIDLNMDEHKLGIDWNQDTRDKGDHMNYNGAQKVTTFLAQYLEATGMLHDHRGDETYGHWHDSYNRYIENIKKGESPS